MADCDVVASSYDTIAKSHEGDLGSMTTPFRNFNNFVKRQLIQTALDMVHRSDPKRSNAAVLDLASGRGGDIGKWLNCRSGHLRVSQYHCFDISPESIKEAEKRYAAMPNPKAEATFEMADCFSDDFLQNQLPQLPLFQKYSVVSIQFAFHYACDSEARIEKVLKAVAGSLHPGGVFIATTVNEEKLAECVLNEENVEDAMFSIRLMEPVEWITTYQTKKRMLQIGSQYHFQLEGFVDSPEYVVPLWIVKKHAAVSGLVSCPDGTKPFDAHLDEYNQGRKTSTILKLTPAETNLIRLYRTLCFSKETPFKSGKVAHLGGYGNRKTSSSEGYAHRGGAPAKGGFGSKKGGFGNFLSRDMFGKCSTD